MTTGATTAKRRLGDLLVEAGLITESQLRAALAEQKKWGGRLGRTVVELGFTTEETMVKVLAGQLSLQTVDLESAQLPGRIVDRLRLDLAERYGIFPIGFERLTQTLTIATSDPTNAEALRALALATNCLVTPAVATASSIDRAIRRYYFGEFPSGFSPAIPSGPAAAPAAAAANEPGLAAKPSVPPPLPSPAEQTSYELDELLGSSPRFTAPQPETRPQSSEIELSLRRELSTLREKVDSLETVNASQVRALRGLLELLIESGLIARDEYVQKLHRPD